MDAYTIVYCALADCLHYAPEPGAPAKCRCSHPEKPAYMTQINCPLYRMDWQKKLKSNTESVQRVQANKRDKLPQDF